MGNRGVCEGWRNAVSDDDRPDIRGLQSSQNRGSDVSQENNRRLEAPPINILYQ
jgi:hypothetical protein